MNECLLWEKSVRSTGYGNSFVDGKNKAPHIVAWEIFYGPVPKGMHLDHTCHNEAAAKGECDSKNCIHRRCYNPNHLRVVTPSENTKAGLHSVDVKASCPKGHSYKDPSNIAIRKDGKRECAECNRERSRRNWQKLKAGK